VTTWGSSTIVREGALPQKSEFSLRTYDRFSVTPQRGNGLQPRVAASATLGNESNLVLNRNAVASACCILLGENDATAMRLKFLFLLVSRGSRSGNPGLCIDRGHHKQVFGDIVNTF
jgi:hypothetical protein